MLTNIIVNNNYLLTSHNHFQSTVNLMQF
jgi:hypothetical protein